MEKRTTILSEAVADLTGCGKSLNRDDSPPQGLKPSLILHDLRGAKAPLYHSAAGFRDFFRSLLVRDTMIQRQCPECSSELVLARRPDNRHGPRIVAGPSTYWRCSICGREFTAEQIRENKRAKSTPIEHA